MGQLTNLYVSESYQGLIKLANSTTGVTGTLQYTQDGLGNNLPIQISTSSVNITGSLFGTASYATQALSASWAPDNTDTGSYVTTSSFNAYTSSNDSKVNSLISATGSYATTSSLTSLSSSIATTDLSQNNRLTSIESITGSLATTSSLTSLSQSIAVTDLGQDNRLGSLETATGSLQNQINQKLDTGSFNSYTSSNDSKVNSLIASTGSYATTSSLTSLSQSIALTDLNQNNTIAGLATTSSVNTKLDTGSFNSYTSSNDGKVNSLISATGSYATTGSNNFVGQQNINSSVNITGSLNVTGEITALSASITYLETIYQTSSVIFSSGSNILGDEAGDTQTLWGTVNLPSGPLVVTGSVIATNFTGSLQGTASYATQALSASYAPDTTNTGSLVSDVSLLLPTEDTIVVSKGDGTTSTFTIDNVQSASFAQNATSASFSQNTISGSFSNFAVSSSFSQFAISSSQAQNADTASYVLQAVSASYATNALSASYSVNSDISISSSFAQNALSSSQAQNAVSSSHSINTDNSISSSFAQNAISSSHSVNSDTSISSSYSLNSISSSFSQNTISASFSNFAVSASQAQNAVSASYAPSVAAVGVITTGSISTTQSITGSLIVSGTLTGTGSVVLNNLTYPIVDGLVGQVIGTDGTGNLSFNDVHAILEDVFSGEAITKGDPLYISGSQGAKPIVYRADASNAAKMPVTYVALDTVGSNTDTRGIVLGLIEGMNLTGYNAGDAVYVAEGGGWSTSRPSGSASITQLLGVVTKGGTGGKGLVLNPGPATLPTLQTGKLWIGNSTNQPISQSISEIGLATTGSNTFIGNQTITGALFISSSAVNDIVLTGSMVITRPVGSTAQSQLLVTSSVGGTTISPSSIIARAGSVSTGTIGQVGGGFMYNKSNATSDEFGFTIDPSGFGVSGGTGNSIWVNDPTDSFPAMINFQNKANWTDGRITLKRSTDISGSLIVTAGITGSLEGTSSFATNALSASYAPGVSIPAGTVSGSAQIVELGFAETSSLSSYVLVSQTGSMSVATASYVLQAVSASYATDALTASFALNAVSTDTGSLMKTGSVASNVLTFTKGDGSTFNLTVATGSAGSTFPFTGSAIISGSLTVTGSILVSNGTNSGSVITNQTDDQSLPRVNNIVTLTSAEYNTLATASALDANTLYVVSGSAAVSPFPFTGSAVITGSLQVIGDSIMTGSLILSGSANPELTVIGNTILTGSVQGNVLPLTVASSTASLDLNNGNFFELALTGSQNIFINPSNIKPGQTVNIKLNTTGSGTVSFPTSVKQPSGSAYTPTTAVGTDIITMVSFDTTNLFVANVKNLI